MKKEDWNKRLKKKKIKKWGERLLKKSSPQNTGWESWIIGLRSLEKVPDRIGGPLNSACVLWNHRSFCSSLISLLTEMPLIKLPRCPSQSLCWVSNLRTRRKNKVLSPTRRGKSPQHSLLPRSAANLLSDQTALLFWRELTLVPFISTKIEPIPKSQRKGKPLHIQIIGIGVTLERRELERGDSKRLPAARQGHFRVMSSAFKLLPCLHCALVLFHDFYV